MIANYNRKTFGRKRTTNAQNIRTKPKRSAAEFSHRLQGANFRF
jgi:hypothetical protein